MKMQNLKEPIVIMALNTRLTGHEEMEALKSALLWKGWSRYTEVSRVVGYYKGTQEKAYKITLPADEVLQKEALSDLLSIAEENNQECIMFSDCYRICTLLYPGVAKRAWPIKIGKLKQVTRKAAHGGACYTFEPKSRTYWMAK